MIKQNANPPQVTFRRIRGRIVPIVNGKQPRGATKILQQELSDRVQEIKEAERGQRAVGYHEGQAVKNFGTKSTFPSWYKDIGFKNKADFAKVVKTKEGVKFQRLVDDSIEGLIHGRSTSFGPIPPNRKFRLATKQEFDNKDVIFRRIDDRVVPMRIPIWKRRDDEVPF